MILFDIGANRGDATLIGLAQGYKVIALEPGSTIFRSLVSNFIYNENVIPLKFAVSDSDNEQVTFYECYEDGLSTLNQEWLTNETMPYNGKPYRTINATTITIDTLAKIYGNPDLIKIDVEGGEWSVFKGMTQKYGKIAFEWTYETLDQHEEQLKYLFGLGYEFFAPQFIEHHLQEPLNWYPIGESLKQWVDSNAKNWTEGDWHKSGLRPTADVGMCWVR
jgi:FkbM family methyltransferase